MIRAKRPYYGVQHNRHRVEVELSPETLAATRAAICLAILTLRWLADVSSAFWEHQTQRTPMTRALSWRPRCLVRRNYKT